MGLISSMSSDNRDGTRICILRGRGHCVSVVHYFLLTGWKFLPPRIFQRWWTRPSQTIRVERRYLILKTSKFQVELYRIRNKKHLNLLFSRFEMNYQLGNLVTPYVAIMDGTTSEWHPLSFLSSYCINFYFFYFHAKWVEEPGWRFMHHSVWRLRILYLPCQKPKLAMYPMWELTTFYRGWMAK